MSNLHKFACPHDTSKWQSMAECIQCLNEAVDALEETNEWGGWEDLPYETGKPRKITIMPEFLPWSNK